MKLHHFFIQFFIEEKRGDKNFLIITDQELIHQWTKVLRMNVGEQVVLLDNSGNEFLCTIAALAKSGAEFVIAEKRHNGNIPANEVWLYQSLPKKDTFEWIAEKATELGVTHIVPVVSERSEKKDVNTDRLKKIIKEAAEQSERGTLPTLHEPIDLATALSTVSVPVIAMHTKGTLKLHESVKGGNVAVFIGPEGGWSDAELEQFQMKRIPVACLGSQVLRSETAAVATLSLLLFR
jgi:16S rRNA (uracil1498-N3)-methyltransferase